MMTLEIEKKNNNKCYLLLLVLVSYLFFSFSIVNLYSCVKTPKKEKHYFFFNDGGLFVQISIAFQLILYNMALLTQKPVTIKLELN
ncbi:hypothetical protein D9V86_03025 [Bacteroidetes/Chlorobi group bacterium ChocPot_Mid]|nr:MAG: hypothetical protein D9V86_03025 [Bacteroidetes/Chlorobi group bacterium ChocPot_Mid]